ncbi:LytR/AlgR family response regulator transcription factor [Flavobacterium xinjiangense]|uniref:Two component transcriptional regulator, LytTR family n=1 Tax=Flavobacterium xinjiangense TaxID=178356 RepID=A0A1M7PFM0_9FLAO|nr:LytTR family DNA-binding domain-containing protein [Flavobacterium xinjiangense]SHN15809.1 two component transcriptional regulator, LytTR family [Flavobacterium xinjiangense]
MNRYSCIIIEDEPLALERTKNFVSKIPFLNLCATFDNALDGLSYLKDNKVNLLFLDINMDELSGIELLESSKIESQVIITTAYQEYAIKGYELSVTDYLLKPFTFDRFLKAVNRARENINQPLLTTQQDFIFVKTENRLEKVNLSDILYIEGMRDYRGIHTVNKKIMTLQNFSELEQIIPPNLVCRVHKSYMVGVSKIESIERMRILISNQRIPISETYKELFFQVVNNRT